MNVNQPERIGVVCRGDAPDLRVSNELLEYLAKKVEVIADSETANKLNKAGSRIKDMNVDLLICVGGDGTILRTLHHLRVDIPVLGINMGTIGFLADVQPADAVSTLAMLLDGFDVERRERLAVKLKDGQVPYALNEAVVITSNPGKMLHFAIFVDGEEWERLRADGVVFATPTGSTAYAMGAGGPIVHPGVNAAIIVPIAPFNLSARPTVVDINSEINLELLVTKDAELIIDGQFYRKIGHENRISITKGEPAYFVKLRDRHLLKLHDKLRNIGKI
ncbi:NAD(+) kinase [Methanophagales archaeon]|nr:MAG: NAD(+) kinase [Methanophagales archaeon]